MKKRKDPATIVRIYQLVIFINTFICMGLYTLAETPRLEKFFLGMLIISAMLTIIYTIWLSDLEKMQKRMEVKP